MIYLGFHVKICFCLVLVQLCPTPSASLNGYALQETVSAVFFFYRIHNTRRVENCHNYSKDVLRWFSFV